MHLFSDAKYRLLGRSQSADDPSEVRRIERWLATARVFLLDRMSDVQTGTKALSTVTAALFGWMAPWMTNPYAVATVPYWTAFAYHLFLGNEISMLTASLPALLRGKVEAGRLAPKTEAKSSGSTGSSKSAEASPATSSSSAD